MAEARLRNIDGLKGVLLFLVIIGHVLQGKVDQHFGRYVIYSFHMPLFIGISGYLFSIEKMRALDLKGFLEKYFLRVLLPWTLAMLVFAWYLGGFNANPRDWSILNGGRNLTHLQSWSHYILQPYYHLWFVPAYLFWSFVVWIFIKFGFDRVKLLITGVAVGLIFFWIKNEYRDFFTPYLGPELGGSVLWTLRLFYFLFFVLGIFLRGLPPRGHNRSVTDRSHPSIAGSNPQKPPSFTLNPLGSQLKNPVFIKAENPTENKLAGPKNTVFWSCGVGFLLLYWSFFWTISNPHEYVNAKDGIMIIGNVLFMVWLFGMMRIDALPKVAWIEWLGANSLGMYLWHVLPLLMIKDWMGTNHLYSFYGCVFMAELLLFGLFILIKRNRVTSLAFLGV
ncbi:MAG: hypothetical protein CK532_00540 [Flavobacteriales bacterium]|nr:MAG: hypothetical protein CK532_00540 [Flavobacteriales bacterium]